MSLTKFRKFRKFRTKVQRKGLKQNFIDETEEDYMKDKHIGLTLKGEMAFQLYKILIRNWKDIPSKGEAASISMVSLDLAEVFLEVAEGWESEEDSQNG